MSIHQRPAGTSRVPSCVIAQLAPSLVGGFSAIALAVVGWLLLATVPASAFGTVTQPEATGMDGPAITAVESQEASSPERDPEAGNEAGNQAGNQAGNEAGNEAGTEAAAATAPASQPEAAPARRYSIEVVDRVADADLADLGGLDETTGDTLHLVFSSVGAGISTIELASYYADLEHTAPVRVQTEWSNPQGQRAAPFAAVSLTIDGETLDLTGARSGVWRQTAPGTFQAYVLRDGQRVARLDRRYVLNADRYTLDLIQSATNLTDAPLWMTFTQFGPIDMAPGSSLYGGEKRRLRFGWLQDVQSQGTSLMVSPDGRLEPRIDKDIIGKKTDGMYEPVRAVWPDPRRLDKRLVWFAYTDRYFGIGLTHLVDPDAVKGPDDLLLAPAVDRIDRVILDPLTGDPFITRLRSARRLVEAGGTLDLSLVVYAGPMDSAAIAADPRTALSGMGSMVVYKMVGGFCGICTFEPLTKIILFVLNSIHIVTQDWALAIILLVVCVRTLLHPITRFSQSKMLVFSTQMQGMAPKMKKLQEKYKDDAAKLNEERMKLWKEEGVHPAGMLGCLPMFLQSPVWIALYATLFFDIALRHQPAFFGVFQSMGGWAFMSDLAEPDHAIPLPANLHFVMPLMGKITAVNVLPLLLGVVFYAHQKFLTPPTSTSLTPEQESQQKMMKVMSVVMFPVFMYNAPCGLTLYFITNSTLAIFENKWVRSSMKKKGLLDAEVLRAKRQAKLAEQEARTGKRADKPAGGFMQRLRTAAEEAQRRRDEAAGGKLAKPGKGGRNPYESPRDREEAERRSQARYKKRK